MICGQALWPALCLGIVGFQAVGFQVVGFRAVGFQAVGFQAVIDVVMNPLNSSLASRFYDGRQALSYVLNCDLRLPIHQGS